MTNLKGFFNKISNSGRIFTAEDVGEMTSNEFAANEKAIDYQMGNIGMPRRNDLENNSDVVFVQAYTKADGTQVKAHYRSKPDNLLSNNLSFLGTTTGSAANMKKTQKIYIDNEFNQALWNLLYYKNLNKKLENEVGKFLRENTNSPKVYSNDIRHQYAGALYARNKGSNASYALGELNEFFNANQSGYEDTAIDKINNEIGRMYAIKYPNIPKKELLKILLNDWDKNREYAEIIMKTRK